MKKLLITSCLSALLTAPAWADWSLDSQNSNLNVISIKSNSIGEVHHFTQLDGKVTKAGQAEINIDLSSLATGIEIRDERIRNILFETASFTKATVKGNLDLSLYTGLVSGEIRKETITLSLTLRDRVQKIDVPVTIIALGNQSYSVTSQQPLIVNARDYDLEKGVEGLRTIAGLPAIATAVPVDFHLIFRHTP